MAQQTSTVNYARRHLRVGWWSLLGFLCLGFALELLHGFKASLYLDVTHETRRLMWTLAHAHGALLALVHIAYALCLRLFPDMTGHSAESISRSLVGASILLPGGFFAAGVQFYSGDPGLGILTVPVGATCLVIAVSLIARAADRARSDSEISGS